MRLAGVAWLFGEGSSVRVRGNRFYRSLFGAVRVSGACPNK